jgi:hypothetical protein
MNLENEFCRKVHDHHTVLKGEIDGALLEICTRSGLSREATAAIAKSVSAAVDTSTHKMVLDFQRSFKNIK